MTMPEVSVVVPTCGRPELLGRCLDALCSQTLAPMAYELIVVDDRPDPQTQALVGRTAAQAGARGLSVRYLPNHGAHGPAAARNLGWRHASAPLVAFTDDDTVPHAGWLQAGTAAFIDAPQTGAAWGRIVMPIPAQPTDYERDAQRLEQAGFVTANCFCRRAMLERIGGFDERFRVAWREDTDLYFSLCAAGVRIDYLPQAIVEHPVRAAGWGVSLSQQKKIAFDALLYKKHPLRYRRQIRAGPRWDYCLNTAALLTAVTGVVTGRPWLAGLGAVVWLPMLMLLLAHRMRGTRRSVGAWIELLMTSVAIPPLAVFWRAVGAWRFRVLFW